MAHCQHQCLYTTVGSLQNNNAQLSTSYFVSTISLSLSPFFQNPGNRYQNVSIRNFIATKDDGGGSDNRISKMCKAPVKSTTCHHPNFLQAEYPSCHPTNSTRALKGENICVAITFHGLAPPSSPGARPSLSWSWKAADYLGEGWQALESKPSDARNLSIMFK